MTSSGAHPPPGPAPPTQTPHRPHRSFARTLRDRPARLLWLPAGAAAAAVLFLAAQLGARRAAHADPKDIDAAVLHTLASRALPSAAARAYDVIQPSVVPVNNWATTTKARKTPCAAPGAAWSSWTPG